MKAPQVGRPVYQFGTWGEQWTGTKAQLQAVGIGVGMAFPGEPGGPPSGGARGSLETTDPDGYPISLHTLRPDQYPAGIDRDGEEIVYTASSPFLEAEDYWPRPWRDFTPGVQVCAGYTWHDTYQGTGKALAAAGLVKLDELPGQPGKPKVQVRYRANGERVMRGFGGSCSKKEPGYRTVTKARGGYFVKVHLTEEEEERRTAEEEAWEESRQKERAAARLERMTARGIKEPSLTSMADLCADLDPAEQAKHFRETVPTLLRVIAALDAESLSGATVAEFRASVAKRAEDWIDDLWRYILRGGTADAPFALELDKGTDAYADLADAFETIRETIASATVKTSTACLQARETKRRAVEAQNDPAFSAFLATVRAA